MTTEEPQRGSGVAHSTRSTQLIPLEVVRIDGRMQGRIEGNDPKHVEELRDYSDPEGWLPIKLAQLNGELYLVGGFHRVEAAMDLGITHLPAQISEVSSFDEALLMAFEDNKHHGLQLTIEDRKGYARLINRTNPGLSYREIGRRAGINHETAKVAIEGKVQVEVGENRHSEGAREVASPDPFMKLIRLADEAYSDPSVLGLKAIFSDEARIDDRARHIASLIEDEYYEEEWSDLAKSLTVMGKALIRGAKPYINA